MGKDPDVMRYFPSLLSEEKSIEMAQTMQTLIAQRGWGLWAVELPQQEPFIGFVGLHIPSDDLPCSPCVEIGWRLASAHWGKGYATEAATACLQYAFEELNLNEVVAFTTVSNQPSRRVMEKLGMDNTERNFMHPDIEADHPLCEHVLYSIHAQSISL